MFALRLVLELLVVGEPCWSGGAAWCPCCRVPAGDEFPAEVDTVGFDVRQEPPEPVGSIGLGIRQQAHGSAGGGHAAGLVRASAPHSPAVPWWASSGGVDAQDPYSDEPAVWESYVEGVPVDDVFNGSAGRRGPRPVPGRREVRWQGCTPARRGPCRPCWPRRDRRVFRVAGVGIIGLWGWGGRRVVGPGRV